EYGCKAQEMEASYKALVEACRDALYFIGTPDESKCLGVEPIPIAVKLEAALAKDKEKEI
ncbi:hypothetical protein LCGC14_2020540, partial [marine sediment metagenome]